MTPNTPEVGVTTTRDYFWRKFQAKAHRMSYPALIFWESQKFIHIQKKITSLLILWKIWSEKLKNGPKIPKKKLVEQGGKGARVTPIRPLTPKFCMATHPQIWARDGLL